MFGYEPLLVAVIALALLFDFVNGWHDSANAIATVVGTRVLSPAKALMMAAVLNMAGAFLGQEVAKMVGGGIVNGDLISYTVLLSAMSAAIFWEAVTLILGIPVSASHALVGGLMGAAVAKAGVHVVVAEGVLKVMLLMLLSPILGFIIAYFLYVLIANICARRRPGPMSRLFGKLQLVSAGAMALSHGTSDAQKAMGIITVALAMGGHHGLAGESIAQRMQHPIPYWVVVSCAFAMALGTALGGWRIIKTLGHGLSRLKPVDGFCAETAASLLLFTTSRYGFPVSTTQTITGSILGVAATKGKHAVKWGLGGKIFMAWIFTFPTTMALGLLFYWILWGVFNMDPKL